mmetsp:Transcript_7673/g.11246  ORF Transcript_7673/g.11246 Transcript_7673/m.11246 type:complete len:181 (+) Transcript_7673:123-665(+)|eukprot:CAMPEP_0197247618 /NCGR_PEP_ID=MMETSP1429-20130617/30053_1 /TAXON_ID=49237 /ORGANISM="Chaetoceros  sp., Strain UNC1202" /LENGTH=180 /DNA_ID=CAMNT_0042708565 /DNA_START=86 /DNA_END=628 /DNA_ORIENTATION=-
MNYCTAFLHTLLIVASTNAFVVHVTKLSPQSSIATGTALEMAPGGWGIGTPIDMQDEEFSKGSGARRRRRKSSSGDADSSYVSGLDEVAYGAETAERAANKYAMEDPMQFSKRVQDEKSNLQMQKKKDLLEIAKIAGLGDRLKPKVNDEQETYGKFAEEFDDEAFLSDDDDSLDVRVTWN